MASSTSRIEFFKNWTNWTASMKTHRGRQKRLIVMFTLTFTYMMAELTVGYVADSIALIADSFHMFSDVIALIVAFISIVLSPKKWKKSTFGWARAEVVGALINSVFLLALCFSILMESLQRFVTPKPISEVKWVMGIGLGGLLVNLIGLCIFHEAHGHAHIHTHKPSIQHQGRLTRLVPSDEETGDTLEGTDNPGFPDTDANNKSGQESPKVSDDARQVGPHQKNQGEHEVGQPLPNPNVPDEAAPAQPTPQPTYNSTAAHQLNMRGIFLHVMADTMGSVVVIVSAAIVWTTEDARKSNPYKYKFVDYVDPCLSLIMITLIVISSFPLLQETAMILLQTVPSNMEIEDLKKRLREQVSGILGIHEFHIWQLAGDRVIASIHIVCHSVGDYIRISREAKDFFHMNGIHSTTIQAEFLDYDSSKYDEKSCLLNCPPPGNGNTDVNCATNTCCGNGTDNNSQHSKE